MQDLRIRSAMRVVRRGPQIVGLKHGIHATVVGKPVSYPVPNLGCLGGICRLEFLHFGKAEVLGPTKSLHFDKVSRNAFANQVVFYDLCASLRELHIVSARATAVSMRFEQKSRIRHGLVVLNEGFRKFVESILLAAEQAVVRMQRRLSAWSRTTERT